MAAPMLCLKVVGAVNSTKFQALLEMVMEDFKGQHTITAYYPPEEKKKVVAPEEPKEPKKLEKIASILTQVAEPDIISPPNRPSYVREYRRFNGRFNHPSGKSMLDFLYEFLAEKDVHEYRDIERRLMAIGYSKNSLPSLLQPMVQAGTITRMNSKIYINKKPAGK